MDRRSLTRFLIALAATLVLGVVAIGVGTLPALTSSPPSQRPAISASEAISIELKQDDGPFTRRAVSADGTGCEILAASDLLGRACVLTTNLDPAVIAGEAFGQINVARTPSLEALIWRGIIAGDTSVCARGGLVDPFLAECTSAVQMGTRTTSDHGWTVRISPRD